MEDGSSEPNSERKFPSDESNMNFLIHYLFIKSSLPLGEGHA
jgi:hypothetical protein